MGVDAVRMTMRTCILAATLALTLTTVLSLTLTLAFSRACVLSECQYQAHTVKRWMKYRHT